MRKAILVFSLIAAFAVIGTAAEWSGFWGGGVPDLEEFFPGIADVEPGRWTDLPICWGFSDSEIHAWTQEEQAAAQVAISQWNQVDLYADEANPTQGQIFENNSANCQGRSTDIILIWGDESTLFQDLTDLDGDGIATNFTNSRGDYIPIQTTPQFQFEPCGDMLEAGFLPQCSAIIINADFLDQYFVDPTPSENDEFLETSSELCGEESTLLLPVTGGPADGLLDFQTTLGHYFGHALGLLNSFGCDGTPFTQDAEDDDGSIMFGGDLEGRRLPSSN